MGKGAYGTVEFWDEYYVDDRPEPYDWFFEYEYIAPTLAPLLPDVDARILIVGCGNSPFSAELFAHGYRRQVNVDNCELVEVAWAPGAATAACWRRLHRARTAWEAAADALDSASASFAGEAY